ncbi:PLXC1 protein, partial [Polyodon spathula]|nr:PLXC1 protein [Polyodon spathula]
LQIVIDQNQKVSCPEILYESPAEKAVFFKMLLDPVEQEHVYMASGNELTRIKVANCSKFDSWKTCWLAQDPFCGWCAHENRSVYRHTFLHSFFNSEMLSKPVKSCFCSCNA